MGLHPLVHCPVMISHRRCPDVTVSQCGLQDCSQLSPYSELPQPVGILKNVIYLSVDYICDIRYRWRSVLPQQVSKYPVTSQPVYAHHILIAIILNVPCSMFIALLVLQSGSRVPIGQLLQPLKSSQETGHPEQSGINQSYIIRYIVTNVEHFECYINSGGQAYQQTLYQQRQLLNIRYPFSI